MKAWSKLILVLALAVAVLAAGSFALAAKGDQADPGASTVHRSANYDPPEYHGWRNGRLAERPWSPPSS